MNENSILVPIFSRPGIKRDGTAFEGDHYTDGKWVRWQRGRPRKIGGYRNLTTVDVTKLDNIARSGILFSQDGFTYLHVGTPDGVFQYKINPDGSIAAVADRTPVGYVANPDIMWQFDVMYNAAGSQNVLVANPAPNLTNIDNATTGNIYYGLITASTALVVTSGGTVPTPAVCGGIVSAHPYLFLFCKDGYVTWTEPNNPDDVDPVGGGGGTAGARVTQAKIVRGLVTRGGQGASPAALFWSLNALIRATFVGGVPVFNFDVISDQISIMGANTVVEYNGVYYWMGIDRFMMFNGVVRDMDNPMNTNFVFDNVNLNYRQKCFAFKVPKYGEIWFCYVHGNTATEPNKAVIFNVHESNKIGQPVWYDTDLPNGGRSFGTAEPLSRNPVLGGVEQIADKYNIWQHEYGVDEVDGDEVRAIRSYFDTGELSLMAPQQGAGINRAIHVSYIEPDFVQVGNMSVKLLGRRLAQGVEYESEVKTFPPGPVDNDQALVNLKVDMRQVRFRFESNVVGGDYQMGNPIVHASPTEGRIK